MSHIDGQLTESLRQLAAGADEEAADRVIAGVNANLRTHRRHRVVIFGSGVAAAAMLVSGLYATGITGGGGSSAPEAQGTAADVGHQHSPPPAGRQHQAPNREGIVPTPAPGQPCIGAQSETISQLAADVAFPVWMPDTANASISNLANSWNCGNDAALTFTNGVTIYYEPGWSDVEDPAGHWAAVASQNGGGTVTTVLGHPALVGSYVSPGYPDGELDVIVDGDTLMRLYGNGTLSSAQLIAIANSITVSQPLPHT